MRKLYLALCVGVPSQQEWVVDAAIGQHPQEQCARLVGGEGAKPALTSFAVVAANPDVDLADMGAAKGATLLCTTFVLVYLLDYIWFWQCGSHATRHRAAVESFAACDVLDLLHLIWAVERTQRHTCGLQVRSNAPNTQM